MKPILDIILYVGLVFSTLLTILLVPGTSGRLMVITPAVSTGTTIYGVLEGTDARLVSKISDHRYVVENTGPDLISQLYQNGAFLVLNAAPVYSCGSKAETVLKSQSLSSATLSKR